MFTYILAVVYKIFKTMERSAEARARRYLTIHNPGAWQ